MEQIERNHHSITIPPAEVERLVRHYGPRVRSVGRWNKDTDGSVDVPMSNITLAVERLGDRTLAEALDQLKAESPVRHSAAAEALIETLADLQTSQNPVGASPESEFFKDHPLDSLVAAQGIKPMRDLSVLSGGLPADEDVDEFINEIYSARK
jgi:hypothetical protein